MLESICSLLTYSMGESNILPELKIDLLLLERGSVRSCFQFPPLFKGLIKEMH